MWPETAYVRTINNSNQQKVICSIPALPALTSAKQQRIVACGGKSTTRRLPPMLLAFSVSAALASRVPCSKLECTGAVAPVGCYRDGATYRVKSALCVPLRTHTHKVSLFSLFSTPTLSTHSRHVLTEDDERSELYGQNDGTQRLLLLLRHGC